MASQDPAWYQNAIFYELYIRAYRDTNGDGHGDLRGVIEKLDYIKSLGVDCIWLLPFYPSPLKDDGYDIADYYDIHPDFGTLEDFQDLLDEAHARGLRVISDLVVNHTSDQHPWFIEARASRESPRRDWYVWSDTDERYPEARVIFLDTEDSNWEYDEQSGQFYWHRFYSSQPDLNYDNPDVREAMLDVMAYWMEKGVDGFRVDAVPYLYERERTNCENLPETHDYLQEMRRFMERQWPEAIMLCEANQLPEDVVDYLGEGNEFHMAFNFPVMPRIFMVLRSGEAETLHQIIRRTPSIPKSCAWCVFLRNHDELTLEMVSEEERQWMWQEYAPEDRMRINLGIRRRLAPLLDNDPAKIMLANRILFSLPGAAIVYYGDEIGMGDNISLPDRDGVRTPMQWDGSPHAGFSDAPDGSLYAPVIDDTVYGFGYADVNVAAQEEESDSLLNRMRRLIALRKRHPVFGLGDLTLIDPQNPAIVAFTRIYDEDVFVVLHNLSPDQQAATLDLSAYVDTSPHDVLAPSEAYPVIGEEPYVVAIEGLGSRWLQLRRF
jgi:maltose alpha-D-glucosyltransferase/alpha-amylase